MQSTENNNKETSGNANAGDTTKNKVVPCAECRKNKSILEQAFPIKKPVCIGKEQIERLGSIDAKAVKEQPKDEELVAIYNQAFRSTITLEAFTGPLKTAIVKDLKKYYEALNKKE